MKYFFLALAFLSGSFSFAQNRYELNSGWLYRPASAVTVTGEVLSRPGSGLDGFETATVPGTVLTNLIRQGKMPDPFYGMNNERIPDIWTAGRDTYTYWFVKEFEEKPVAGKESWLLFRGINYYAAIYLNGHRLNPMPEKSMFLRQEFRIGPWLRPDGKNRLAVLVFPPDHPGNPNGGQGGDGRIARDLTHQYVAGWDWIQPVRDRNTGIWDKVLIERSGAVKMRNPHVVTLVPGQRFPDGPQAPATIQVSAELENTGARPISGELQYQLAGKTIRKTVQLPAGGKQMVRLPDYSLQQPRLWWPNGYGEQALYDLKLRFVAGTVVSDEDSIRFGIRQIDNHWNAHTQSMQAYVNGQPIFIKGGNWIISDALLRFSEARYDAEVRYHRDMNLNLIRIWGGALTERPEFYAACDKYGLLVFQDFWFSGDCNGRWMDPQKADDQWVRRSYPDDHGMVIRTMADQIRLIRNHPSLAFWCGGNEITPPAAILKTLKDSLLPALDGTRLLFDYSNSDSMSRNSLGGNGDGPYGIQEPASFWTTRSFPYNSEIGSVGLGDLVSLERFLPAANLSTIPEGRKVDSVWQYHKYIGYGNQPARYGPVRDVADFAMKVQLVNYDQYRSLAEGFSAHMWDWYTGVMIWKTQNPWTALRGQMYDYYLDPNACLYGLRTGAKPLHIQFNPADSMVWLVNNGFRTERDLMMEARVVDILTGRDTLNTMVFNEIGPSAGKKYFGMAGFLRTQQKTEGCFVLLRLKKADGSLVDENLYWLPGTDGKYSALANMPPGRAKISAGLEQPGTVWVEISNPAGAPVAFFNRLALVDKKSGQRILPAFADDNYVSVMPGSTRRVRISYEPQPGLEPALDIYGWNLPLQRIELQN